MMPTLHRKLVSSNAMKQAPPLSLDMIASSFFISSKTIILSWCDRD